MTNQWSAAPCLLAACSQIVHIAPSRTICKKPNRSEQNRIKDILNSKWWWPNSNRATYTAPTKVVWPEQGTGLHCWKKNLQIQLHLPTVNQESLVSVKTFLTADWHTKYMCMSMLCRHPIDHKQSGMCLRCLTLDYIYTALQKPMRARNHCSLNGNVVAKNVTVAAF